MPTRKEASKYKQDWIKKRNEAINSKLNKLEEQLYEMILPEFLGLAKQEEIRRQSTKNDVLKLDQLEKNIKRGLVNGFPFILQDTVKAARSLGDLNQVYFSTLMESNRLEEIREKTDKIVNKRLGVDENGKLIKNGFTDRMMNTEKLQKTFVSEVNRLLKSNADVRTLQHRLKTLVLSSDERNGLLSQHYNTFAKDILSNIDRGNNAIYANELGLKHFYFTGGLIKSSRPFCLKCNGKIFSTEQVEKWRDKLNQTDGPIWNEKVDGKYDPIEHMGGYGCLHTADWITDDLAKGNIREQNSIASERNEKFKERHGL